MTWRWCVLLGALLLVGCEPAPRMATDVDVEAMRQMLANPGWTDDEWQEFCEGSTGTGLCRIQVQIDCPPDCGTYRIVREDALARRIW